MGLITVYTDDLAGKQAQFSDQLEVSLTTQYNGLLRMWKSLRGSVWVNPQLTPQQVFDALGTNAAALVGLKQKLADLLNAAHPGSVDITPPGGQIVTVNQDGTVTVTAGA